MTIEFHRRSQAIFLSVVELPEPDRSAFLDHACPDDPELRAAVERMLEIDACPPEFLARSPFSVSESSESRWSRIRGLVQGSNTLGRIVVEEEIACGGMGAILRVRDAVLRRTLAMKVIRGQKGASSTGEVPGVAPELVDRFLAEAEVTGRLEHPGVVPVHELGVDAEGRLYFTMPLVGGRTFAEVIRLVHDPESSWTRTRALLVLQKVCETMSYAHDAGFIHRDLKPANVMVGEYGEVYVMDWGLARERGAPSEDEGKGESPDRTRPIDDDSAFVTREGAILGTPFYMPPEQARGERVDAASDIHAVGAMLYHLLAGDAPYSVPGKSPSSEQVLADLRRGPPAPIGTRASDLAPELAAICEKAMAREAEDRYADMADFARDLQAFLEGRVVRAHRTGAWIELRKWVGRNRAVATATAAALIVVLLGAFGVAAAERRSADLSRSFLIFYLEQEESALWPAVPEKVPAMETWLADAEDMGSRIETAIAGLTGDPRVLEARREGMRDALARIHELEEDVRRRIEFARTVEERSITSAGAREAWTEAIAAVDASEFYQRCGPFHLEPQLGLLPLGENPATGLWEFWQVGTGSPPEEDPDWNPDWVSFGSPGTPNRFRIVESPDEATSVPTEGSALVFVLLPPANGFLVGSQKDDPAGPNFEPRLAGQELVFRPYPVDIEPFFVSKYEFTQGQWQRIFGSNPSVLSPSFHGYGDRSENPIGWTHPVNYTDGVPTVELLARIRLRLPTEEEWEYAARADTHTTYWFGDDPDNLEGVANVWGGKGDVAATYVTPAQGGIRARPANFDDHYLSSHPVGVFRASPFGLHDIYGNIRETCLTRTAGIERPGASGSRFEFPVSLSDADDQRKTWERIEEAQARLPRPLMAIRGGGFSTPPDFATSGLAEFRFLFQRLEALGVRPVRPLDPPSGD